MQKAILLIVFVFGLGGLCNAQLKLKENKTPPFQLFPKKELPFSKPIVPQTFTPEKKLAIVAPQKANNSIVVLNNPLKYAYNNQKGFDVYVSGIDGMPVLMPDKKNAASLGIIIKREEEK